MAENSTEPNINQSYGPEVVNQHASNVHFTKEMMYVFSTLFLIPPLLRELKQYYSRASKSSCKTKKKKKKDKKEKKEEKKDKPEDESKAWKDSKEKKSEKWKTIVLVFSAILPYLSMDLLEEGRLFFKFLDLITKLISTFIGENVVEEAESMVSLLTDIDFLSLDQLALLFVFVVWPVVLSYITKDMEDAKVVTYLLPLLAAFSIFTIELLKAAAADGDDLAFVEDEWDDTGDYMENFIFLFFLLVWAFIDVNNFIMDTHFEIPCLILSVLLMGGFLFEVFDASFPIDFEDFESTKFTLWKYFTIFYFWFNRVLLWPAYLSRYVFYSLFDKVKKYKDLDSYMLLAIPIVWLFATKLGLQFLWYLWCPFIIILRMNMLRETFIEDYRKMEWKRKWQNDIFNEIEKERVKVTKIYLINVIEPKSKIKVRNHRTVVEWSNLIEYLQEKMDIEWDSKVLEMCIPFEELNDKLLDSPSKFMIIASCPHVLVEEVTNKIKNRTNSVLLEYDGY